MKKYVLQGGDKNSHLKNLNLRNDDTYLLIFKRYLHEHWQQMENHRLLACLQCVLEISTNTSCLSQIHQTNWVRKYLIFNVLPEKYQ